MLAPRSGPKQARSKPEASPKQAPSKPPASPNALALTRLSSMKRTVRAGQHAFACKKGYQALTSRQRDVVPFCTESHTGDQRRRSSQTRKVTRRLGRRTAGEPVAACESSRQGI